MTAFRVWVRPLANASRLRVEGLDNTHWLLWRLSQSFVFKSSEPLCEETHRDAYSCYSFQVMLGSQLTHSSLNRLLAAMPELTLVLEPA